MRLRMLVLPAVLLAIVLPAQARAGVFRGSSSPSSRNEARCCSPARTVPA